MKALFAAALHSSFFAPGFALMVLGAAMALARKAPEKVTLLLSRTFMLSVEIRDRDCLNAMEIWLSNQATPYRALAASFRWPGTTIGPVSDPKPPRVVLSPGRGSHLVVYAGRVLMVSRDVEDSKHEGKAEFFSIKTLGRDPAIFYGLLSAVAEAYIAFRRDNSQVYVADWDEWHSVESAQARPLESVVLRAGLMEEVREDLEAFQRRGAWYAQRGIPYRRGYLFEGPPGTGKTSLVRALTAAESHALYVLNLASRSLSDDRLLALLARVPPGAAILVEDVDCAAPHRPDGAEAEGKSAGGLTLSGLLNALDGILSAEGRVLFMTTNRPEVLDQALVRPGRVDLRLHLGLADQDQARRMFLRFFPGEELLAGCFANHIRPETYSPAELQGLLLAHADEPTEAMRAAGLLGGERESEVA